MTPIQTGRTFCYFSSLFYNCFFGIFFLFMSVMSPCFYFSFLEFNLLSDCFNKLEKVSSSLKSKWLLFGISFSYFLVHITFLLKGEHWDVKVNEIYTSFLKCSKITVTPHRIYNTTIITKSGEENWLKWIKQNTRKHFQSFSFCKARVFLFVILYTCKCI